MKNPILEEILYYPIKSCRGNKLLETRLDERGIPFDRHWMLVDSNGGFLSQRSHPALALVRTAIVEDRLLVNAPSMPEFSIPTDQAPGDHLTVTIWSDRCKACRVSDRADEWFSDYLRESVRLVYMPPSFRRPIDSLYAAGPYSTGFSDGFPLLLLSRESLEELNRRLSEPVPVNRFRPNLVLSGAGPFAEDTWSTLRIGEVTLKVVKPCARCVITTTNQETGKRSKEPLKTLATFRKKDGKILFGQNVIHRNLGTLRVGDIVCVRD